MRTKLHRIIFSTLLAASVALVFAPAAEANRGGGGGGGGGYVPASNPGTPPVNIQVDLPGATTPQVDNSGGNTDPGSDMSPEVVGNPALGPGGDTDVLGAQDSKSEPAPANEGGVFGGVLSRTGSETMPLVRAGLAAITLGAGLVMLGRRRRQVDARA